MRQRLVLLALDELDAVVDQVRREVLELLLGELDLLEPGDDLVVGEEALLLAGLDELVQLLDLGKGDVDREQLTPTSDSSAIDKLTLVEPAPPPTRPRDARDSTSRFPQIGRLFPTAMETGLEGRACW